jgi:DNA invertase Pin-like site-specific DNA recombinase
LLAYILVSTDEQADSGNGMHAQLDCCQAYAARVDMNPIGVYLDAGVSGAAPLDKRPGLFDLLADLRRGDLLLVAKRDRLGRDPIVVAMIEAAVKRQGGRIVSVAGEGTDGDSPTDILMRRIVDAFAEYERLIIKARTVAALQARRSRGERVGPIPYGMKLADDHIHVVPDTEESATLEMIARLRSEGLSQRAIARALDGVHPTKNGRRWASSTIHGLLRRDPRHAPIPPPRGGQTLA